MSQLASSLARAIADHQGWPADWDVNQKHTDLAEVMFDWMERVLWPAAATAPRSVATLDAAEDADDGDEIDPALWRDRDFDDAGDYLNEEPPGFFADAPTRSDIVLGTDEDGDDVVLDVVRDPHLLLAGRAGVGKTDLLRTIIRDAASRGDHVQVVTAEGRKSEFDLLAGTIPPVADSLEDALFVLREMKQVLDARIAAVAAAGAATFRELPEAPKPVVLVIDQCAPIFVHEPVPPAGRNAEQDREREAAQAVNGLKDLLIEHIGHILTEGRAAGFTVILATQQVSGSVLRGLPATGNIARVLLGNTSRIERIAALKSGLATADKDYPRGHGVFEPVDGDPVRFVARHLHEPEEDSHRDARSRA